MLRTDRVLVNDGLGLDSRGRNHVRAAEKAREERRGGRACAEMCLGGSAGVGLRAGCRLEDWKGGARC
jgi:hypothetical protein